MSITYISADLRRLVVVRAANLCEYCLIHNDDTLFSHEIDHILSEKHGGLTQEDNLAYACFACNRNKGSDIASLEPEKGGVVRFFHPRQDAWHEHFALDASDGITFFPRTAPAEATVRIFGINNLDRLLERQALQLAGRYPTEAAQKRMDADNVS